MEVFCPFCYLFANNPCIWDNNALCKGCYRVKAFMQKRHQLMLGGLGLFFYLAYGMSSPAPGGGRRDRSAPGKSPRMNGRSRWLRGASPEPFSKSMTPDNPVWCFERKENDNEKVKSPRGSRAKLSRRTYDALEMEPSWTQDAAHSACGLEGGCDVRSHIPRDPVGVREPLSYQCAKDAKC